MQSCRAAECHFVVEKKGKQFVEDCQVKLRRETIFNQNPPQLSKIGNRLTSFKDWPEELEMKPEELAEAGFYHDPVDDLADQVSGKGTKSNRANFCMKACQITDP